MRTYVMRAVKLVAMVLLLLFVNRVGEVRGEDKARAELVPKLNAALDEVERGRTVSRNIARDARNSGPAYRSSDMVHAVGKVFDAGAGQRADFYADGGVQGRMENIGCTSFGHTFLVYQNSLGRDMELAAQLTVMLREIIDGERMTEANELCSRNVCIFVADSSSQLEAVWAALRSGLDPTGQCAAMAYFDAETGQVTMDVLDAQTKLFTPPPFGYGE